MTRSLVRDAVLRIGEVSGIEGRKVYISVDKNKNSSDLLLDGEIIKNVSVGAYVEIRKGFLSIVGKAEGETLREDPLRQKDADGEYQNIDKNKRVLTISLSGYIGPDGRFVGGIKELPLIGNEAYVLTDEKIHKIHNLLRSSSSSSISIAKTAIEEVPVRLPIDGLFNSHIAIFGNTGSGKSNTLAFMYQELISVLGKKELFKENCRFLLLDFNGEYRKTSCITSEKIVYNLSTREDVDDKIPVSMNELLDVETLSVLVEATEKTQKPFLKRTLRFFKDAKGKDNYPAYLKAILQNKVKDILQMANKDVAFRLLDYMEEILGAFITGEERRDLRSDIDFHNKSATFYKRGTETYFNTDVDAIEDTKLYKATDNVAADTLAELSELSQFRLFLHLQLAGDLFQYKVQNDHIYPVINRFRAKQRSIERTFEVSDDPNFWGDHNFMRKTIPLLLAKNVYNAHKKEGNKKTLNIIVDEAHNILSKASFRETDEWRDYRLETFEEIIKEGRKFGVFMTIASQRPNDISETIISQAHNYFIHQLINQKDLLTIGKAVSYIDKITEESIPTLSVGTCIFSGVATPMPLKLRIDELPDKQKPDSRTLKFEDVTKKDDEAG
jgi:Cdc6-like AAA superfamily ATPase